MPRKIPINRGDWIVARDTVTGDHLVGQVEHVWASTTEIRWPGRFSVTRIARHKIMFAFKHQHIVDGVAARLTSSQNLLAQEVAGARARAIKRAEDIVSSTMRSLGLDEPA